jgi:putative oxidoreductase
MQSITKHGTLKKRKSMRITRKTMASTAPRATILVRILVGAIFLSEGIQKFLFPESLGVGRFAKIGIPAPSVMAPFVGVVEIVFGACMIAGILTRLSAIPLLIDISVAIATTKVPMLLDKGFWAAAHEARTDVAMLLGLVFLLIVGAGPWSIDRAFSKSGLE